MRERHQLHGGAVEVVETRNELPPAPVVDVRARRERPADPHQAAGAGCGPRRSRPGSAPVATASSKTTVPLLIVAR